MTGAGSLSPDLQTVTEIRSGLSLVNSTVIAFHCEPREYTTAPAPSVLCCRFRL